MKDLMTHVWHRRYSSVSTSDTSADTNPNKAGHISADASRPKPERGDNTFAQSSAKSYPNNFGTFSLLDTFFYRHRSGGRGGRWPKCIFLLMATGVLAIGVALLIYFLQPYDCIFKWKLQLSENGEIFNLWAKPPIQLYLKIYLFNVTNAQRFMTGKDSKMHLAEIGPYVYREIMEHTNVTFNANGTLSTRPRHPLVWQQELSEGRSEQDVLILPNIALLSIANIVSERSYFVRMPVNILVRQTNSHPLVQMTAHQFMFGFQSPLTTLGNKFLPDWIYFEKVGLIDRMYDFDGDFETFFTGAGDPAIAGLYDTFNGDQHLRHWHGDHCAKISYASDGSKFKSFITPNESLLFFRKNMCRPQRLVRVQNETVHVSGLDANKYMFEANALDNGAVDERNKCFCRKGRCLPNGLIDVTDCYYGFPVALSYPHFLDADPIIASRLEGMRPNRSEHETYFMIEPKSGLPLKLSVKFQINMAMQDVSRIAHVENFANIVLPMLWFEITLNSLPNSLQSRFYLYLNVAPTAERIIFWVSLIGGSLSLLIAVTRGSLIGLSNTRADAKPKKSKKKHQQQQSNYLYMSQNPKKYGIYMPCEEKSPAIMYNNNIGHELTLLGNNTFVLECEPALSDSDDDQQLLNVSGDSVPDKGSFTSTSASASNSPSKSSSSSSLSQLKDSVSDSSSNSMSPPQLAPVSTHTANNEWPFDACTNQKKLQVQPQQQPSTSRITVAIAAIPIGNNGGDPFATPLRIVESGENLHFNDA